MKIALISDLHENYPSLPSNIDMIIFCGDFAHCGPSNIGYEIELWNMKMGPYIKNFREKGIKTVAIPGNHDAIADNDTTKSIMSDNFDIFSTDGLIEYMGFNFLFFAYCKLRNWAMFMPDQDRKRRCDRLSIAALDKKEIDFLITHTPPINHLSLEDWGCPYIQELLESVKPKHFHAFGHVHEKFGLDKNGNTTLINCSSVDKNYKFRGEFFVYDTISRNVELRNVTENSQTNR